MADLILRRTIFGAVLLLCGLALPSLSEAACTPPVPINKSGATGSPFATKDVTKLDTQTSDAVKLTGGCIDGVTVGGNTGAAGNFTEVTTGGPWVCDGFSASDGAITTGTRAFNAASAHFTAADVGKPISIREAGALFFVSGTTLSNGGSGHAVGDTVTFSGTGTGDVTIYVRAVTAGVITAYYVTESANAPTQPATLSQSATTGAGTGAVIGALWLRKNLVTTIAAVTDGQNVVLTDAASATVSAVLWGYGTDNQTRLQASITAGIPIKFPAGRCAHSNTITFADRTILEGQGIGLSVGQSPTELMYVGAHSTQGTQIYGDADSPTVGGTRISGAHIGGFELNGLGAISRGIRIAGAAANHFRPIKTTNHITVGYQSLGSTAQDSIKNVVEQLELSETLSDLNAHAIWLGFPNTVDLAHDPDRTDYGPISATINTAGSGTPMVCGATDHNTFAYIRARGPSSRPGIDLLGGNWAGNNGNCRDNTIRMDAGNGGGYSRATGYVSGQGARNNIQFYDMANGAPALVTESGAFSDSKDNLGRQEWAKFRVKTFAELPTDVTGNTLEGTLAFITDSPLDGAGSVITVGGGALNALLIYRSGSWRVLQSTDITNNLSLKTKPFASVPADAIAGALQLINDSTVCGWGETIAGSGSNAVVGVYTGAVWRVVSCVSGTSVRPQSVMLGSASLAGNTTTYLVPGASATSSINAAGQPVTRIGAYSALRVRTENPPGGVGKTFTITLNYGADGAIAATTLTCVITNAQNSCVDSTHSVSVAAGLLWNVGVVTSATADPTGVISVGMERNNQ